MRDYILTESTSRDSTFAFAKLRRVVRNWMFKRTLKALQQLDDHMLGDVGLARHELHHLTALPLDVDLISELTRLRDLRARHPHLPLPSEQGGHLPVQRPERLQPSGVGRSEGRVGRDLGGDRGLAAHGGRILAGRS